MRVIQDLIEYLNGQGLLDPDDLAYLRRHGFMPLPDEPMPDRDFAVLDQQVDEPDDRHLEDLAPPPRRRRSGRPRRAADKFDAGALSARILAAWPDWEAALVGLRRFADRLERSASLEDGLRQLQRASAADLDAAVIAVLRGGKPALTELWGGLAFNGYHNNILLPGARGAAVVAYRAILSAASHPELGAYRTVLRAPGVAQVFLLVQAQRAILHAFGRCLARMPELFDRPLFARRYHEVCYWSLTIAASGLAELSVLPLRLREPARPRPEHAARQSAWHCASAMTSRGVARLLAKGGDKGDDPETLLRCPSAWDRGYGPPSSFLADGTSS